MDLRERVQRLRHKAGLSQEECAHRAKIHQTYLSGVENGVRNPTVLVLGRLAKALGVEADELLRSPAKPKGKKLSSVGRLLKR
jgi:transcriptional regulator with XRE-family HTH domain